MTATRAIKGASPKSQIVAVLFSTSDVQRATRMRRLPDLFELRLDALYRDLPLVERLLPKLAAKFILTARHPAEGGLNKLSASKRSELFLRFLPQAAYIDIELRSVKNLQPVLAEAEKRAVKLILSVHDFRRPPTADRLNQWARAAQAWSADILKIVTRTQTREEFEELMKFFERTRSRMALCAMGVGAHGRESRICFAAHASALNYVHLGNAQVEGQLSLDQMRRVQFKRFAREQNAG